MCRVKVRISGGDAIGIRDQEYYWSGQPAEAFLKATSFAQGYAFALSEGKYHLDMQTPHVPQTDGFMWWLRGSDFKIEVQNMKGEAVKSEKELE